MAFTCALLAGSLACSTTRTLARPVTESPEQDEDDAREWLVHYRPSLPPEVREAALADGAARDATGSLADETARKPSLEGDVLRFTSLGGHPREVSLDAVRAIRVDVIHWRGGLEGIGFGAALCAGAGALIGYSAGDDPPGTGFVSLRYRAVDKALFGGLLGVSIGAGLGMLFGSLIGHREYLEFTGP